MYLGAVPLAMAPARRQSYPRLVISGLQHSRQRDPGLPIIASARKPHSFQGEPVITPTRSRNAIAVIAVAADGTTYRIERRSQLRPQEAPANTFFYCCLPDGQLVDQIGSGTYQLPDGTIVRTRRRRDLQENGI